MMIKKIFLLAVAFGFIATSCSDDDDAVFVNPNAELTLNLSGLEELGSDYVYEGWIIVDGAPVSTGTFTSVTFPQTFTVNRDQLNSATTFVLSIEPAVDPDPAPAATKILAGDFSGTSANVNSNIVGDFSNADGTFFFRTPTDEVSPGNPNNMNDEYGVWFGAPGMPPTGNFDLPTLPEGWAYEGWVIGENGPISTGTFTDFSDRDSSNMFSGTEYNMGPPIPGEDFFLNPPSGETFPLNVASRMIVISVEPVPDDSPAPFAIKPLLSMPTSTPRATAPNAHGFDQNLGSLPTGSVSRN